MRDFLRWRALGESHQAWALFKPRSSWLRSLTLSSCAMWPLDISHQILEYWQCITFFVCSFPPTLPWIASDKDLEEKCAPAIIFKLLLLLLLLFFYLLIFVKSQIYCTSPWPSAVPLGLMLKCVTEMPPTCVYVNNLVRLGLSGVPAK